MPTHTYTSRGFDLALRSLGLPATQKPLEQPALPRFSERATNTLNDLELDTSPLHATFKQWILNYGVSFVAHAVAFERASEVISGSRTRESFIESITGEKRPGSEHNWRAFPLSQLQAAVFIPPCWNQNAVNPHKQSDPTITLLGDDLANCFFDPTNRQQSSAIRALITRAQDLDSLLTPKILLQGLNFIRTGWSRAVSEYVAAGQNSASGLILGVPSLMDYYQEVIDVCASRTRAQLPPSSSK